MGRHASTPQSVELDTDAQDKSTLEHATSASAASGNTLSQDTLPNRSEISLEELRNLSEDWLSNSEGFDIPVSHVSPEQVDKLIAFKAANTGGMYIKA